MKLSPFLKKLATFFQLSRTFQNAFALLMRQCYDVTYSGEEGSTALHPAKGSNLASLAGGDTLRLFLMFGKAGQCWQYS